MQLGLLQRHWHSLFTMLQVVAEILKNQSLNLITHLYFVLASRNSEKSVA
jgi:hypothetical protein